MTALQQIGCNIFHSCQKSGLRSWLEGVKQKWGDAAQVSKEMHNKSIGEHRNLQKQGKLIEKKKETFGQILKHNG